MRSVCCLCPAKVGSVLQFAGTLSDKATAKLCGHERCQRAGKDPAIHIGHPPACPAIQMACAWAVRAHACSHAASSM